MNDIHTIEANIFERLSHVIDPELGRSVTDLGMITSIEAVRAERTCDDGGDVGASFYLASWASPCFGGLLLWQASPSLWCVPH